MVWFGLGDETLAYKLGSCNGGGTFTSFIYHGGGVTPKTLQLYIYTL